jgi:hypothetical protein
MSPIIKTFASLTVDGPKLITVKLHSAFPVLMFEDGLMIACSGI